MVGGTPGGLYNLVKRGAMKGKGIVWSEKYFDLVLVDEASQMGQAEALLAAAFLREDGQFIAIGDHRQMPPIVQHDWESEPRRTFQEYQTYQSLFNTLRTLDPAPAMIKLDRSFRLHAEMAEFLRREIYARDGIPYHSRRTDLLEMAQQADPFVAAVLAPVHPIVVVVHDESGSQTRNLAEQQLLGPILEALAAQGFDPLEGLGVVVPHRAQRADLQGLYSLLTERDPTSGVILNSAVDTVERFQGGERTAIIVSATESDRDYLLASTKFLFDPRRLTVAISRAKRKMVLIASRSLFTLFSPDEETFHNAQLWKNLLNRTCTVKLWEGEQAGTRVEVWGNAPSDERDISL